MFWACFLFEVVSGTEPGGFESAWIEPIGGIDARLVALPMVPEPSSPDLDRLDSFDCFYDCGGRYDLTSC